MFHNTLFSINLITGVVSFIGYAGAIILLPFYLQNILGYGIRGIEFLMTIVSIMLEILSPISGSLYDRFGTRPVTILGLFFLLTVYSFLTFSLKFE